VRFGSSDARSDVGDLGRFRGELGVCDLEKHCRGVDNESTLERGG
jgi:hypothetical protein